MYIAVPSLALWLLPPLLVLPLLTPPSLLAEGVSTAAITLAMLVALVVEEVEVGVGAVEGRGV